MKRQVLSVVGGALLFGAAAAQAGWSNTINTERDSGIEIRLSSPIDNTPECGFVPITILVRNHSPAAHTWSFHSASSRYNGVNGVASLSLDRSIEVAGGQALRVRVLAPVAPPGSAFSPSPLNLRISGYGVENGYTYFPTSQGETLSILVSETLDGELWAPLRTKLMKPPRSTGPAGSLVDPRELGPDWRALLGFQSFWLTPGDYAALDPATQAAVRDWVAQGGQLYLCADSPDPGMRAAFGFPDATAEQAAHGSGAAHWVERAAAPELALAVITSSTVSLGQQLASGQSGGNRLADSLGRLQLNLPLLMIFIILFAVLVGPVNLFWIAGADRRPRLFWTTPAISVGASLLLLVLIVCEDGFGGAGRRIMVVQLLPAEQKEVITQEQATRTGVLLSSRFESVDDLFFAQLALRRPARGDCWQGGHVYDGAWFASRRVQAQLAEAIVPTRAEVQLLNARAAGDGAPPVVTSSIAATLDTIVYLDPQGASWAGRSLHTGERQTLRPAVPGDYLDVSEAGGALTGPLNAASSQRRGYFCAQSGSGPFIATLPSIRWNMQKAVYTGPVTVVR